MEFEKIELSIPIKVKEIFHIIHSIEPDSIIAGGFLSDLYMKKTYKDIDIFIKTKNIVSFVSIFQEQTGYLLRNVTEEYETITVDERGVYEFEVEEDKFQLIFTGLGKNAVKYFDIRMREFYYDGETFASKEALSDICHKKIMFGIVSDPIKALYRMYRFKKKYEFDTDSKNIKRLYDSFIVGRIRVYTTNSWIKSRVPDEELKKHMIDFTERNKDGSYINPGGNNQLAAEYLKNKAHKVERTLFDKIYEKKETLHFQSFYSFKENPILHSIQRIEGEILELFQKNLLKMLFEFATYTDDWRKNIHNKTYLYHIFYPQISLIYKRDKTHFSYQIVEKFQEIKSISTHANKVETKIRMNVSDKWLPSTLYFDYIDLELYLENNILTIDMDNIGVLFVNAKTGDIILKKIEQTKEQIVEPYFEEIISCVLEERKKRTS